MLYDGIELTDTSTLENASAPSGNALPTTGNNRGELFFLIGTGLHVYTGSAWVSLTPLPQSTPTGNALPTSGAKAGDLFFLNGTGLHVYSGSAWVSLTPVPATTPSGSALPVSGARGDLFFLIGTGLHVYNGTSWVSLTPTPAVPAGPTWSEKQVFQAGLESQGGVVEKLTTIGTGVNAIPASGSLFLKLLQGNVTLTFPAVEAGKQFTLLLAQDAVGSRLVTWPTAVRWGDGGAAPTLTTTASRTDVVSFICDGTFWLGFVGGLNFNRA